MSMVKGLTGITAGIDGVTAGIQARSRAAVLREAEGIVSTAKQLCPVLTGALRASIDVLSIQHEGETWVAEVGTTLDYAAFVEFGTIYMDAQPYMRPALHTAESDFIPGARQELFGAVSSFKGGSVDSE